MTFTWNKEFMTPILLPLTPMAWFLSSDASRADKMVFLTFESANKAEINILSARDTTRPGPQARASLVNDAVVYKGEYSTWCPSRPQNQPSTSGL